MNKFLKGAVACAAIVPCLTGLVGCGEKKEYTSENAFNAVMGNVNNIVTKMEGITTPGKEFQLSINLSISSSMLVNNVVNAEESFAANLRAVIGARHSNNNKELFGHIGMVNNNVFTSVVSAYMADDVDSNAEIDMDEKYTAFPDNTINATNWNEFKGLVYVLDQDKHVVANGDFDEEATYYALTEDLMNVYLLSNPSALKEYTLLTAEPSDWEQGYANYYKKDYEFTKKLSTDVYEADKFYKKVAEDQPFVLVEDETEPADWATGEYYTRSDVYFKVESAQEWAEETYYEQTGIDINELLNKIPDLEFELPEGSIYATLNLVSEDSGDEGAGDDVDEGKPEFDIEEILNELKTMDYNTFIQSMGVTEGVEITGNKDKKGNATLTMSGYGSTIKLTAKANGGVSMSVEMMMLEDNVKQIMSMTLDIDLEDEIDESYIPTNLEVYGESEGDLLELIAGLMGGNE